MEINLFHIFNILFFCKIEFKLSPDIFNNILLKIYKMEDNKGIIYLLQPDVFNRPNLFKIGYYKINNYKKLTINNDINYVYVMECNNSSNLENKLKITLKNNFKCNGDSFFEGNEKEIKKDFMKIVVDYINEEGDINEDKNNEKDKEINKDIKYPNKVPNINLKELEQKKVINMYQVKPSRKPYSSKLNQLQPDGTKKPIEVRHYEYKNKNMTIKDIEKFSEEIRKKFIAKNRNALLQLVIETPFGYMSGKFHFVTEKKIQVWKPALNQYYNICNRNYEQIKWYDEGNVKPYSFTFNTIYTNKKEDYNISQLEIIQRKLEKESKIKIHNQTKKDNKSSNNLTLNDILQNEIIVKCPNELPNINDIDILELDKEYFIDKKNNVYQMTDEQDIGQFLGIYDEKNNKIILEPNELPNINDIDILELDQEYFIDKKKNVYQITEDQEVGIFLGVYDEQNNKIIQYKK